MKRKYNPKNERAKRKYCIWIQEARRKSERTVDQALAAISLFELSTGGKDFASFHIEQARAFKRGLAEDPNPATGKPYAMATIKGRRRSSRSISFLASSKRGNGVTSNKGSSNAFARSIISSTTSTITKRSSTRESFRATYWRRRLRTANLAGGSIRRTACGAISPAPI